MSFARQAFAQSQRRCFSASVRQVRYECLCSLPPSDSLMKSQLALFSLAFRHWIIQNDLPPLEEPLETHDDIPPPPRCSTIEPSYMELLWRIHANKKLYRTPRSPSWVPLVELDSPCLSCSSLTPVSPNSPYTISAWHQVSPPTLDTSTPRAR